MANLFPMHLGKKEGFKGVKTEMSVKMVRFCKVCLRLGCVFRVAFYGSNGMIFFTKSDTHSCRQLGTKLLHYVLVYFFN